jgi:hypothetical protein
MVPRNPGYFGKVAHSEFMLWRAPNAKSRHSPQITPKRELQPFRLIPRTQIIVMAAALPPRPAWLRG